MSNILSNQATPLSFMRVKADKLNEIPAVEGQFILTDSGEIWHDINQTRKLYGPKTIIVNGAEGKKSPDKTYDALINYINQGYQLYLKWTYINNLYFPCIGSDYDSIYFLHINPNAPIATIYPITRDNKPIKPVQYNLATNDKIEAIETDINNLVNQTNTNQMDIETIKTDIDNLTNQTNTNQRNIEALQQNSLSLEEIAYEDLKAKRDTNKLTPGTFYAITDYEFIPPKQDYASGSHRFDIVVQALDDHTLSETAYARANSNSIDETNYAAWELKYCLDNDDSRFEWAMTEPCLIGANSAYSRNKVITRQQNMDNQSQNLEYPIAWGVLTDVEDGDPTNCIYTKTELLSPNEEVLAYNYQDETMVTVTYAPSGKGIIYYMKDEHNNECSYDFKNVMFKWGNDLQTNYSDYFEAIGLQAGQTEYFYTFSALSQKNEEDSTSGKAIDITSYITGCHNNDICYTTRTNQNTLRLNGNIFIAGNWDTKEGFDDGDKGHISSCYNNLHGQRIWDNIFFSTCHNNTLKELCYGNIFFKSTNNTLAKGNAAHLFNTSSYVNIQENGQRNRFIAANFVELGVTNQSIELNNVNNIQLGYDNYGITIKYSNYIQFNNDNKYITINGDENMICEFTTIDSGYKYTVDQPLVLNRDNASHHYYSQSTYAKDLPDATP